MARIMCTQTLSRRLGNRGRPPGKVDEPLLHGAALGSWAAKIFKDDGRDLVIALNERTCLTLVFALPEPSAFRSRFASSLIAILEDLHLLTRIVAGEANAIQFEPLARLPNGDLKAALDNAQYLCELDLFDVTDLRAIQLHLSEYPHSGTPDPGSPIEAVQELFRIVMALVRRGDTEGRGSTSTDESN
jgi:hypothetical protein